MGKISESFLLSFPTLLVKFYVIRLAIFGKPFFDTTAYSS